MRDLPNDAQGRTLAPFSVKHHCPIPTTTSQLLEVLRQEIAQRRAGQSHRGAQETAQRRAVFFVKIWLELEPQEVRMNERGRLEGRMARLAKAT